MKLPRHVSIYLDLECVMLYPPVTWYATDIHNGYIACDLTIICLHLSWEWPIPVRAAASPQGGTSE